MIDVIYVANESTRMSDEDVRTAAWACTCQIATDFAPAWGLAPVRLETRPTVEDCPAGPTYAILLIRDDAGEPGALGWHTESGGRVLGVIGVSPVLDSGGVALLDPENPQRLTVASVLSHEVLETLADQWVNSWADGPRIAQGSEYAIEVCDPVETDQYTVEVENVGAAAVSNFVLPAWFDPDAAGQPVDKLGTAPGPFQLAPGGYMVVRSGGGDMQQVFAAMGPGPRQARPWRTGAKRAGFRSGRRVRPAR